MLLMLFFFFNDTATTEIYTLSLHDALPISQQRHPGRHAARQRHLVRAAAVLEQQQIREAPRQARDHVPEPPRGHLVDRKSTRLNSSHANISYAVFCLKKKNHTQRNPPTTRN